MMCLSTALTSCFKDEPLNAECDIEQAYIHVDNPEAMFFSKNDTLQKVLYTEKDVLMKWYECIKEDYDQQELHTKQGYYQ